MINKKIHIENQIVQEELKNKTGATLTVFMAAVTVVSMTSITGPIFSTVNDIGQRSISTLVPNSKDQNRRGSTYKVNNEGYTSLYFSLDINNSNLNNDSEKLKTTNVQVENQKMNITTDKSVNISVSSNTITENHIIKGGDVMLKNLKSARDKAEKFAIYSGLIGGILTLSTSLTGLSLAITLPPSAILLSLPVSMVLKKKVRELVNES